MGQRGPRPQPTVTLKASGTYRPGKHGGRMDEQAVSGAPVRPEAIDETAGALWDQITAEHAARGTLGGIDTSALQALCEIWSLYRKALEVAKDDPTDKDARCSTLAYLAQCDKLGAKFGWTASDRANIKLATTEQDTTVAAFARRRA